VIKGANLRLMHNVPAAAIAERIAEVKALGCNALALVTHHYVYLAPGTPELAFPPVEWGQPWLIYRRLFNVPPRTTAENIAYGIAIKCQPPRDLGARFATAEKGTNLSHRLRSEFVLAITKTACLPVLGNHIGAVLCVRSCKKVRRITANLMVAFMAADLTRLKRTVVEFIAKAMCRTLPAVDLDHAVTGFPDRANPHPTGAEFRAVFGDRAVLVNLRPETRFYRSLYWGREEPQVMVMKETQRLPLNMSSSCAGLGGYFRWLATATFTQPGGIGYHVGTEPFTLKVRSRSRMLTHRAGFSMPNYTTSGVLA
jgi:hypothetical protein